MSTMMPLLFLAGSPGPLELLVIFAVVLVLFGPRKLPEIARSIGRMLHELRKASEDFKAQIMAIEQTVEKPVKEVIETLDDVAPHPPPSGDMATAPPPAPDAVQPDETESDSITAGGHP